MKREGKHFLFLINVSVKWNIFNYKGRQQMSMVRCFHVQILRVSNIIEKPEPPRSNAYYCEDSNPEEVVRPPAGPGRLCHSTDCPWGLGAGNGIAGSEGKPVLCGFDAYWKNCSHKITPFHLPTSSTVSVCLLKSLPTLYLPSFVPLLIR